MKINLIDEDNIIIYLNKYYTKNTDFNDKNLLEDYFKKLFKKLNKIYDIDINGYFNINVYIDKYYGVIIEIKKEDLEYYSYFNDQIEMQIMIYNDVEFLYLYNDYFDILNMNNNKIYKYNNKYYLKLEKEISNIELAKILEFTSIIYSKTDKIIKNKYLVRI